jgi:hypothetical protein
MIQISYDANGSYLGAPFAFTVELYGLEEGGPLTRSGHWRLRSAEGLGTLAARLKSEGYWTYRLTEAGGSIYLHGAAGPNKYRAALDDVPRDYLHGPFCSSSSGPGYINLSSNALAEFQWAVNGPGCA